MCNEKILNRRVCCLCSGVCGKTINCCNHGGIGCNPCFWIWTFTFSQSAFSTLRDCSLKSFWWALWRLCYRSHANRV